jgi:hypothetical protein
LKRSAISFQRSAFSDQLSAISFQRSAFSDQLSAISRTINDEGGRRDAERQLWPSVHRSSFIVHHSSFIIHRSSFKLKADG